MVQAQLFAALNALNSVYDGGDANAPFLDSCRSYYVEGKPLTGPMMNRLHYTLTKYSKQLQCAGIALPSTQELYSAVQEINAASRQNYSPTGASATLDADNEFFYFWYDYPLRDQWDQLKTQFNTLREQHGAPYCGSFHRFSNEARPLWLGKNDPQNKRWRFPKAPKTLALILEHFPGTVLLDGAARYKAALQDAYKKRVLHAQAQAARQQSELEDLLSYIGGIEAPFGNGKKLFEHQQYALEIMLKKRRFICGDQTGVGKTYESIMTALALQKKFHWPIILLTTKSSRRMWQETAAEVGAEIEAYTWAKPPIASNENPAQPFILVCDEAHNAANFETATTRRMLALAWHPNCKACYMLTGTPYTNGRPINGYTQLLAVRHPLVYVELFPSGKPNYPICWSRKEEGGTHLPAEFHRKRRFFEDRYCDRKEMRKRNGDLLLSPSGKVIWDISGISNGEELARKTLYIPGSEDNDPNAVLIARTKFDCRASMPPKTRTPIAAEISPEAKKLYYATVLALYTKHEKSIADKVAAFKEQWPKDHGGRPCPSRMAKDHELRCRRADAMQEYERFRHAGAVAKAEHVYYFADYLLQQSNRLLIYTTFEDVAYQIGERIAQATGRKIGYIYGNVSEDERNAIVKDFQDPEGETSVVIFGKAGSEAITLNRAREIIVVDRPWTTGAINQAEDRGYRITDETPFTSYWMQMPEDVCLADKHVDAILDGKQVNVDLLQFNRHTSGIEFVAAHELPNHIHQIIKATVKRIRNISEVAA